MSQRSRAGDATASSPLVPMGVVHPHGLKGELKVVLYHPESDVDWRGLEVTLRSRDDGGLPARRTRVDAFRRVGPLAFVRLGGIPDRTAAEAANGLEVALERASLPELEDDEIYLGDLVGLRVCEGETEIGVVREIRVYPASSCAVVARPTDGEIEVPVREPYVAEVDLVERVLRVAQLADLVEGTGRDEGPAGEAT